MVVDTADKVATNNVATEDKEAEEEDMAPTREDTEEATTEAVVPQLQDNTMSFMDSSNLSASATLISHVPLALK